MPDTVKSNQKSGPAQPSSDSTKAPRSPKSQQISFSSKPETPKTPKLDTSLRPLSKLLPNSEPLRSSRSLNRNKSKSQTSLPTSNEQNDTPIPEPNYRAPVDMSGWVLKYKAHLRTNHVRRYFRLNNSILSNHPQLTGPSTWDCSVSKCIVRTIDSKNLVIIKFPDRREIRFQLATEAEMRRWADAIRSASVCNIEDFYRLGEQLGFGSFGAVRLGYDIATGEKRAVKIVERTSNAKELEFVQREVNVLLSISHPNIVRTYDIFDERNKIYLVMEFIQGGDFFDYIVKKCKMREYQSKHVMWQILQGIAYLHENNIVHRDIKPENILVASTSPLTLQLTDFGFANFIDPTSAAPATDMKSMVGTGCYMAPEVIDGRGHGKPVDIFATGVVMYRVLTGRLPFRGMTIQECYKQAMSERIDFNGMDWKGISQSARRLCRSMLSADPAKRPAATEAIQDDWFQADGSFVSEIREDNEKAAKEQGGALKALSDLTKMSPRSIDSPARNQDATTALNPKVRGIQALQSPREVKTKP